MVGSVHSGIAQKLQKCAREMISPDLMLPRVWNHPSLLFCRSHPFPSLDQSTHPPQLPPPPNDSFAWRGWGICCLSKSACPPHVGPSLDRQQNRAGTQTPSVVKKRYTSSTSGVVVLVERMSCNNVQRGPDIISFGECKRLILPFLRLLETRVTSRRLKPATC